MTPAALPKTTQQRQEMCLITITMRPAPIRLRPRTAVNDLDGGETLTGSISYTATDDPVTDSVTYTSDGGTTSSSATLSILIHGANG